MTEEVSFDNYIIHALGGIDGKYNNLNSVEVMEKYYNMGFRRFEADVCLTSDGVPVLEHGWKKEEYEKRLGIENYREDKADQKGNYVPSYEEFMKMKSYGQFKTFDFASLCGFMHQHDDLLVMIEIGKQNYEDTIKIYTSMAETVKYDRFVMNRWIVKASTLGMLEAVRMVYNFPLINLFLDEKGNREELIKDVDDFGLFCNSNNIQSYSVILNNNELCEELIVKLKELGLSGCVFHVNNDKKTLDFIKMGMDYIISDYPRIEKENSKKNNAIVFFVNNKMQYALAEMLVNLQDTNPNIYDNVVVYHSDLTNEEIEKFKLIEPKIIFKKYTLAMWIDEHKEPKSSAAQAFMDRYTHLSYSKYKIFELLEKYHKVLYLDLDMLILGDISNLFEMKGISWRNASDSFKEKFNKYDLMKNYQEWFESFPENSHIPNAGLIYISDDSVDYVKCIKDGRNFLVNFLDNFSHAIDELTFSWIMVQNDIHLNELNREIYNTLPAWYCKDSKIIHFMYRDKIWNSIIMQSFFPKWRDNYKKALQIAPFYSDDVHLYDETCVRKVLNQESWSEFFRATKFQVPEELVLQYDLGRNVLVMRHKSDIFYEIVLSIYTSSFKCGLWIRDEKIIKNENFIEDINKCGYHVMNHEKGIYVYSDEKNALKTAELFKDFYLNTIQIIELYELNERKINIEDKFFSQIDAGKYFSDLRREKERYIIVISGKDECSKYFDKFIEVTKLPLKMKPEKRNSYVAIVCGDNVITEQYSENKISMTFVAKLINQMYISIISEGWREKKEKSSIVVNNIDYSMNERGLNIVIIDKDQENVFDSFNIDTWKNDKVIMQRNHNELVKIKKAEQKIQMI